jgi:hypothetical protein
MNDVIITVALADNAEIMLRIAAEKKIVKYKSLNYFAKSICLKWTIKPAGDFGERSVPFNPHQ